MPKQDHALREKPIFITAAVFYTFKQAAKTSQDLHFLPKLRGGQAAVIVEKDLRGDLRVEEMGSRTGKGAATGAVLGGLLGVLTGGASLGLAALGGVLGGVGGDRARAALLRPELTDQIKDALAPGTSAILIASKNLLPESILTELKASGAEIFSLSLSRDQVEQVLVSQSSGSGQELAEGLRDVVVSRPAAPVPYRKIHIVINPAAGKDEPILNLLNRVFRPYNLEWDVSITQKFGDAQAFARRAIESGYDLVVGYGGDGTQHEIANALMGSGVVMGVLPGGTGNGFANELGIPNSLAEAAEVLCTSRKIRKTDIVQLAEGYFIQRLYIGIEPEQQTSREVKDKYGTLAYAITAYQRRKAQKQVSYRITIDGKLIEMPANKVYVVNAAQTGTGIAVTGKYSRSDDGLLEVFILDLKSLETISAAATRMFNISTDLADKFIWQGKQITIETNPDQPVWTDGEYIGRTPVTMKVVPGGLSVAVPEGYWSSASERTEGGGL
jgi:diacylglycerol kinase (ATP)